MTERSGEVSTGVPLDHHFITHSTHGDRTESSILNMHVILQAWRGPSSAFVQLVSVYFPVARIRTPPGQAWNTFLALLYLTSASGVVLTTSSVLGKLSAPSLTTFSDR